MNLIDFENCVLLYRKSTAGSIPIFWGKWINFFNMHGCLCVLLFMIKSYHDHQKQGQVALMQSVALLITCSRDMWGSINAWSWIYSKRDEINSLSKVDSNIWIHYNIRISILYDCTKIKYFIIHIQYILKQFEIFDDELKFTSNLKQEKILS